MGKGYRIYPVYSRGLLLYDLKEYSRVIRLIG